MQATWYDKWKNPKPVTRARGFDFAAYEEELRRMDQPKPDTLDIAVKLVMAESMAVQFEGDYSVALSSKPIPEPKVDTAFQAARKRRLAAEQLALEEHRRELAQFAGSTAHLGLVS
jgi:hypothetical protein